MTMIKEMIDCIDKKIEILNTFDTYQSTKREAEVKTLLWVKSKLKELAKKDLKMIENISTNFSVGQADYTIRLKLEKDLEEVSK